MKAVLFHRHGGPEVLEYTDFPAPEPSPGEALIRLHAAAINRMDVMVRNGWPGLKLDLPHINGADGAGVISSLSGAPPQSKRNDIETGELNTNGGRPVGEARIETTTSGSNLASGLDTLALSARYSTSGHGMLTIGDPVVINANLGCGECEFCLAGKDNLCLRWHLLGETIRGTYAEFVSVPIRQLYRLPKGFDFHQAAAAALVYQTAWHSLVKRGDVQSGENHHTEARPPIEAAAQQGAAADGAQECEAPRLSAGVIPHRKERPMIRTGNATT